MKNLIKVTEQGVDRDINYADESFDMASFRDNFRIDIVSEENVDGLNSIVFDVIGIDAPIANALRRIMLSRVPTMALDQVTIEENTSEIPDEILAHRLGLVPLRAPANQFEAVAVSNDPNQVTAFEASNSLKFTLDVLGPSSVYSKDLRWVPAGNQSDRFKEFDVGPIHDNILLCVLAPGQQIRLTAIAVLGRGELHAKWSPVATAFYRLRPLVRLKRPVKGKEAVALKEVCPLGVFDIEDGGKSVVIAEGRACTMCRECVRHHPELVELSRVKNHFIFCVESTGAYLAKDIVKAALEDFRQTLRGVLLAIEKRREAALQ